MTTEHLEQSSAASESNADKHTELSTETNQFVTFIVSNEVFAVELTPVQEIIRVPNVVRVPLAPAMLDGFANLRGKVLPIVSLRKMFGFAEQEHDDATRVVVVDVGQPIGFVVDRVTSVISVEPKQIDDVGNISCTVNTDVLSGLIKDVAGHAMIMVLDFVKLIAHEFSAINASSNASASINPSALAGASEFDADQDQESLSDELQLVSFSVAGQEYAIAIEDVQEIVQIPEEIIHVPRSQSHVLGVMTLRSRLLPLVELRRMFRLPNRDLDEKCRIVVLTLASGSVGVAVDSVSEVLRVAKAQVDSMPGLLARDSELADISNICRLNEGKRLVSIISAQHMFDQSSIREALSTMNQHDTDSFASDYADGANDSEDISDDEQLVVFRLGKEEFGIPIVSVQEIVRVPEQLIKVPKSPVYVEGVINLRGSVLPVIDLRTRMGLERLARADSQRIMVFLIGEVRTGFIVDQVAEVLKVSKLSIEASPSLSAEQGKLLSRIANLEKQKRMVQLMDPSFLVEDKELEELAETVG